jgi:diguanylate cyclase (GGDEF)-like protein
MNAQSIPGLLACGLRQLDGHRAQGSVLVHRPLELAAATPRELKLAFAVVCISVLVLAAAIPFARIPLPKITAFIPSYESALAISDLVTAVLLFGRVSRHHQYALLLLASGYLFNAAIIVVHGLSFPGVFSETGLLGASGQTTAWLYVFWHGGFPLFVLGYALLPEQDSASDNSHKDTGWVIAYSAAGVLAIVAALTLLVTAGSWLLPTIIQAGNYSLMVSTSASPTALGLSALALLALWLRPGRTVLDVWLMIVMGIWICDVTLSAVVSSSRYDLGWYGGRSYGFVAACSLLIVLLLETNRLHGRLTKALAIARTLEQHLTFRAENDFLTGLPNRALFHDRLEMAMMRCRRNNSLMALLFLDVDNFKKINDGLGHAAGDDLLRSFALRLSQCVRASDTVARLGGDEFTVILENLSSRETAQALVDKLQSTLRRPHGMGESAILAKASIGIAYFTGEALQADDLMKQADAALYEAKQHGRNRYRIHEPDAASNSMSGDYHPRRKAV